MRSRALRCLESERGGNDPRPRQSGGGGLSSLPSRPCANTGCWACAPERRLVMLRTPLHCCRRTPVGNDPPPSAQSRPTARRSCRTPATLDAMPNPSRQARGGVPSGTPKTGWQARAGSRKDRLAPRAAVGQPEGAQAGSACPGSVSRPQRSEDGCLEEAWEIRRRRRGWEPAGVPAD